MSEQESGKQQSQDKRKYLITAAVIAAVSVLVVLSAVIAGLCGNQDEPIDTTPQEPIVNVPEPSESQTPTQSTTVTTSPTEATEPSNPTPTEPSDEPTVPQTPPENISWDELYNFREVNEQVTAKEETNLRDIPSQGEDSMILYTLKNGEIATRIAVSDYGWSKLEFNGSIYYALSSLLTTDLTPPPYQIQTPFTQVRELVTAKEVVNLRTLPSVTHEESVIVAQLTHGDVAVRTGINTDVGWSRIEYNGQILYCISSYLMPAEEVSEPTQ